MSPSILNNGRYLVIKTRGLLEFLSFGLWGETSTFDFMKGSFTRVTRRFWKRWSEWYSLSKFDHCSSEYQYLGAYHTRHGGEIHVAEYEVALRFRDGSGFLPVAAFRGEIRDASTNRLAVRADRLTKCLCRKLGTRFVPAFR